MTQVDRHKKPLYVLIVVLSLILALLLFRVFTVVERITDASAAPTDDEYAYEDGGRPQYLIDGAWYVQKSNIETVLLIGIDKYEAAIRDTEGYRNTEQSDALFLLAIDRYHNTYSILHLNRDTMVNVRALDVSGNPYTTFPGQLAITHTYGTGREDSCLNTAWSVSDYLYGLQIDHYVSFSMDAVAVINDAVGGVRLTVMDDLTPVDPTLIEGAEVTLMGDQALRYIRARSALAKNTNLDRMKRQRQYVGELIRQASDKFRADESLAAGILRDVKDYMVSDYNGSQLLSFTDIVKNYTFAGISDIAGTARQGEQFMEFYADEDALQARLLEMFYTKK